MATLTWQDVAGRVAAPDFSDASALITQGIEGLGKSVSDLGSAPDQRRKAELAKQAMLLNTEAGIVQDSAKQMDALGQRIKIDTKEKDVLEFSKNQSYLESASRKAAMDGIPLPDFLATDKVYQSMGDGAKAYSAGRLSDAYLRGDETRITMEERAKDDAYRAQQDAIRNRQWAMGHALQVETTRLARAERAEARAAAEAASGVIQTKDPKTKHAMQQLFREIGSKSNEASGAAYATQSLSDLGKGYKNLGAVENIFNAVNQDRVSRGLGALPDNVLKRIVDKNAGKAASWWGENGINDNVVKTAIETAGTQFDQAQKENYFFDALRSSVETGSTVTDEQVRNALTRLRGGQKNSPPPPKNNQTRPSKNNRESMVPELAEIVRGTQMVYDPHLGREVPVGSYTTVNPRPADKPREIKPLTRGRVTLTVGDVIKPPSY